MKTNWTDIKANAKLEEDKRIKEKLWTNRIVKLVIGTILIIVLLGGGLSYVYIHRALQPVNKAQTELKTVTIPMGSHVNDIAKILEDESLIKNKMIFANYLKFKSVAGLQAGHYELSQSMSVDEIIDALEAGGQPIQVDADTKITVVEGMKIEEIAELIESHTPIKADEILSLVNDSDYLARLNEQFPSLMANLNEADQLKYKLEGYLFPATYDYFVGDTAEGLLTAMVEKMNLEYLKLKEDLANTWLSFHQVLTLASIVEKEGSTEADRQMIAGVFMNRLNANMPLQSDITVLYALNEHKEYVTISDTQVDSPYNLYLNSGLGPGPYNSPSLSAIKAVIYPTYSDYYYFVADITTGKVYYSASLAEHESLVDIYVKEPESVETDSTSQSQE